MRSHPMRTRPFTEAHAIALVEAAFLLDKQLSNEHVDMIARNLAKISDLSTLFEFIGVAERDAAPLSERHGVELRTDKDEAELVRIAGDTLRIRFKDYRGWRVTREEIISRFISVREAMSEFEYYFSSSGLMFIDIFHRNGIENYSCDEVFNVSSPYFPGHLKSVGPEWSVESSWHTSNSSSNTIAQILDLNSSINEDEDPNHTTGVRHRQLMDFLEDHHAVHRADQHQLREWLDQFHQSNCNLIKSLLNIEMLSAIGLGES
jgi:hypothetical protein